MATETPRPSLGLVITGAPYDSQAPQTALSFARAAIAQGARIQRVFLYSEGVQLASDLLQPPSDETNWHREWRAFLLEHRIPVTVCVASALRRGILDSSEASRFDKPAPNVTEPFCIGGLGDWVELLSADTQVIYFLGQH
ncbi:MAG: sulfurtransferase complex subunit TusD [Marinobacter sp.]|nr:sulfurtransferase complex subunit TusD [Marinobacter sp.]